jgi:diketogulonate reductase-like aldo/keto reductase
MIESSARAAMHTRIIPSSGAPLPVIGCGTWENFDTCDGEKERAGLAEVLRALFSVGGSVIDTSPMYGHAEKMVGDLLTTSNWHDRAFVATKVWTQGRDAGFRQMRRSLELLQQDRIDLMQVHNLVDWRTHLATLREWKVEGRIKYLGVTHYDARAYHELESVMRSTSLDFVQINYSLDERAAEKLLLPLAMHRGIAVIVNLPFAAGRLLRTLRAKPVPSWAGAFGCESWAQLLLKFVLSQNAVTCVIPGTGNPRHMAENCRAGNRPFLDAGHCDKLRRFWDTECR